MTERDEVGVPLAYAPPPAGERVSWYYVGTLACIGIFVLGALMLVLRQLSPRFPPPIPLPTTRATARPANASVPAATSRPENSDR